MNYQVITYLARFSCAGQKERVTGMLSILGMTTKKLKMLKREMSPPKKDHQTLDADQTSSTPPATDSNAHVSAPYLIQHDGSSTFEAW